MGVLYTRTNVRKSNTLRHFEVEAVRECFLKELGMLNPFLGSAKVKNAYFVDILRYSTLPTKYCKKYYQHSVLIFTRLSQHFSCLFVVS